MRDCKACGKKIPKARLEVLPETQFCVKCVDKNDAGKVAVPLYSIDGTDVALVDQDLANMIKNLTSHEVMR